MTAVAVRVVITDDHAVVRTALRGMLKSFPQFDVVGEAENGSVAVAMVETARPDVVLMDLNMPVLNGIDATRIITSRYPGTKVVILTMHTDEIYSRHAFQAGASCFLAKGSSREAIVDAIRAAFAGESAPLRLQE